MACAMYPCGKDCDECEDHIFDICVYGSRDQTCNNCGLCDEVE